MGGFDSSWNMDLSSEKRIFRRLSVYRNHSRTARPSIMSPYMTCVIEVTFNDKHGDNSCCPKKEELWWLLFSSGNSLRSLLSSPRGVVASNLGLDCLAEAWL